MLKKCLVIAYNVSSKDISNEMILSLKRLGVDVLLGCAYISTNEEYNIIQTPPRFTLSQRFNKLANIIFRRFLKDKIWELIFYKSHIKRIVNFNPDFVLSISHRGEEGVLNLGHKISCKVRKPHIIHLFDPIPPPKGWENFEVYRKSLIHGIRTALSKAHIVSMGNRYMLQHQDRYLDFDLMPKSFVFPDPISDQIHHMETEGASNTFAYIGSFYGARSPEKLFVAFQNFLKNYPDALLYIVGKFNFDIGSFNLEKSTLSRITFIPWVDDISCIVEKVKVLIDIDAEIEGDVFISGKLKKYLAFNRPILSITNLESPTSDFLQNLKKTCFISNHNVHNILEKLVISSQIVINKKDYDERELLFQECNATINMQYLVEKIEQTIFIE